ncbi:hypothetical protein SASPL_144893 [Salvia splendens]|uniref:PB1 domain-containing protein n=1 Tax=Salvia splendens TaxID=180675 RepID=A0A8X8WHA1_SALSN|nr:uncharacterized protein LOC121773458 [Salvia splendens]KAG6394309.1 hypothetical protein SASPL_144893 [Salvia splendens]
MEQSPNNGTKKVKLLCSYGGQIKSRPSDHHLSYLGGDTKIVAVDRAVKFSQFSAKLKSLLSDAAEISVKYQLPGEDLDALVSLIDDDDVEHMMIEYDRMQRISPKPARLRIFVFNISAPVKPVAASNPDYLFGFDKENQPSIAQTPLDLFPVPSRFSNGPVVHRVPVAAYGYSYGNREQSVYNLIPMMPPVSVVNGVELNGNMRHV